MKQARALAVTFMVALSAAAGVAALLAHHLVFGTPEPRDDAY